MNSVMVNGDIPSCDMCGNAYDKAFTIALDGSEYTFDCFECAITMIAPRCNHCGAIIIGHGVETRRGIYCCVHCARVGVDAEGIHVADRAP